MRPITKSPLHDPDSQETLQENVSPSGPAENTKAPRTARKKASAAGPAKVGSKAGKRAEPVEPETLMKMLRIIIDSLEDDKAEDILTIDLTGRANFADRMVIATGFVDRQIAAMAHHIEKKLGEAGFKQTLIEGAGISDWVLIDTGYVVVHLFKPESRELYGLEKMWGSDLDMTDSELPVGQAHKTD